MKAYVKAWQNVIDRNTNKVHNEYGLNALDAIINGPVREIDEITPEIAEEMIAEFETLNPNFSYDFMEVHTD